MNRLKCFWEFSEFLIAPVLQIKIFLRHITVTKGGNTGKKNRVNNQKMMHGIKSHF